MWAASGGNPALARLLLDAGARTDRRSLVGRTALSMAVERAGRGLRCAQAAALLEGDGAGGPTEADVARRLGEVASGWPVRVETPLQPRIWRFRPTGFQYWPARAGRQGVIAYRIEAPDVPADFFLVPSGYGTDVPGEIGTDQVARNLLLAGGGFLSVLATGVEPAFDPGEGCAPAPCRPLAGKVLVGDLVHGEPPLDETPLGTALTRRDHVALERLLARGTAASARSTNALLFQAISFGDVEAVRILLAAGADVNERARGGGTALIEAVRRDHPGLVRLLLGAGADPHAVSGEGVDVLRAAVDAASPEIVGILLASGGAGRDPGRRVAARATAERCAVEGRRQAEVAALLGARAPR